MLSSAQRWPQCCTRRHQIPAAQPPFALYCPGVHNGRQPFAALDALQAGTSARRCQPAERLNARQHQLQGDASCSPLPASCTADKPNPCLLCRSRLHCCGALHVQGHQAGNSNHCSAVLHLNQWKSRFCLLCRCSTCGHYTYKGTRLATAITALNRIISELVIVPVLVCCADAAPAGTTCTQPPGWQQQPLANCTSLEPV